MKAGVERFARRMWAGEAGLIGAVLRVALVPCEAAWRFVTAARNARADRMPAAAVPGMTVISVGNLAVGGTGKTPFASWVLRILRDAGQRPALVHGAHAADEPRLHQVWTPDLPVLGDRVRIRAVERAGTAGAGVVVLDDGFQHRQLHRDLDLVLLAVEDGVPGPVMPRGPFREPVSALLRADAVILTRRMATESDARALQGQLRALLDHGVPTPLASLRFEGTSLRRLSPDGLDETNGGVPDELGALILTAVARPEMVQRGVERLVRGPVSLVAMADHHVFSERELRGVRTRAAGRPIIVTEKDAVKLDARTELLGPTWVLLDTIAWDWGEAAMRSLITGACEGAPVDSATTDET